MKLKKRLLTLSKMVNKPYQLVWDCCCDHGLLGIKILSDGVVKHVNFVDLVPDLINQLNDKFKLFKHQLPSDCRWDTFCQDVSTLTLKGDELDTHETTQELVIISGVGGELMLDMLSHLMKKYAGKNIDFLLCPVLHTYKLRKGLVDLNFHLVKEKLVFENSRGYELLLINQTATQPITLTGQKLWGKERDHKEYLDKLIMHYQRIVDVKKADDALSLSALTAYKELDKQRYQ